MKLPKISSLSFDTLMAELSEQFAAITDKRSPGHTTYSLSDTLKSAFAMFSLKSPSLLNFRERTRTEDGNLQQVYGIGKIPSDTQMRTILDEVPSEALEYSFAEMFTHLKSSDVLAGYRLEAADNALIVSVDGVEYFSSGKVHCPCCTVTEQSGTVELSQPTQRDSYIFEVQTKCAITPSGPVVTCNFNALGNSAISYTLLTLRAKNPPNGSENINAYSARTQEPILFSCAPNPANEQITINYSLEENSIVSIEILDALQRTAIKPLEQHRQEAGGYSIVVPLHQLVTGTYSVRLTALSPSGSIRRAVQQIIIIH